MRPFSGFPAGKVRLTPIPAPFFTELLPSIDHLGELKVTLYVIWRLDRLEGTFRYVRREDFVEDAHFMRGLGRLKRERLATLDEGLERAVGRGTLLKASVTASAGEFSLYFLNSPKGRAAVKGLEQGKWQPAELPQVPVELSQERPNVFQLYETHIGPLTPMISETLRDAEEMYPPDWIEDAIRIAVENNVRRWRYVSAILSAWQEKGRDEEDRRDSEKRQQYFQELADRYG